MEKDSVYLKVDSRNRVTLTKLSKQVIPLYKARSENGTLILEPVQETPAKKPSARSTHKKMKKTQFTAVKLKTKGYRFNREEAHVR